MQGFLNNIQNQLMAAGGIIAVIGFIVLGILVVLKRDLREAVKGAGAIAVGVILIGGGAALVGVLMSIAKSI